MEAIGRREASLLKVAKHGIIDLSGFAPSATIGPLLGVAVVKIEVH